MIHSNNDRFIYLFELFFNSQIACSMFGSERGASLNSRRAVIRSEPKPDKS